MSPAVRHFLLALDCYDERGRLDRIEIATVALTGADGMSARSVRALLNRQHLARGRPLRRFIDEHPKRHGRFLEITELAKSADEPVTAEQRAT